MTVSIRTLSASFLAFALSTQADARGTGLVFVSNEKTNNVANALSGEVSIVDVASHEVIKAVPVGYAPHSVQVDGLVKRSPSLAGPRTSD
jgi:YVTN family beta-propeller protein